MSDIRPTNFVGFFIFGPVLLMLSFLTMFLISRVFKINNNIARLALFLFAFLGLRTLLIYIICLFATDFRCVNHDYPLLWPFAKGNRSKWWLGP